MPPIRRSPFLRALAAASTFIVTACTDPLSDPDEAVAARAHLETILDVMEEHSINRNLIDWAEFRSAVYAEAPAINDMRDTFQPIHTALGMLGDNHSWYHSAPEWGVELRNSTIDCAAPHGDQFPVPSDLAYIRIPAFNGSPSTAVVTASTTQSNIRIQDGRAPVGWIVDLRGNTGGSLWPMLAGLGPILGEGNYGYFIDPDGVESTWEYQGGVMSSSGTEKLTVLSPYVLAAGGQRVAVFIDGLVAGSGEAVAIALRGRPNTRFFGTPTCGLSTAAETFGVEGAVLFLAVAHLADVTRTTYGSVLTPDEEIADQVQLRERAFAWLRTGQ